jgi:hypothetical protein
MTRRLITAARLATACAGVLAIAAGACAAWAGDLATCAMACAPGAFFAYQATKRIMEGR